MNIKLVNEPIKITNQDGEVVLEAPLMDIYYGVVINMPDDDKLSKDQRMKVAASGFNSQFKTNLSWAELASIFEQVTLEVEALKKNLSSTLE